MKSFKSIAMAAVAIVVATALTLPGQPVQAQGSASLSIAPKKNYVVDPGKSVNDKLTIRNLDTASALDLNLRVVDFTYTDDGGTPKLFLAEDAPQTTWSAKPFLSVPKTVTIPKGGSKTLDMSVKVPAKQGAGSFYSAIVYSTAAPEGGNVGLAASGVTLAFINIPGQVNENLKLEKFGAYNPNKKEYMFIAHEEPQNVAYTLKNNGNVTEAPVGSITLKPMIGSPITINDVNPNDSLALIGQSRTYAACIKIKEAKVDFNGSSTQAKTCESPGLFPGYYSATLSLFYGQNGNRTQEIVGNSSFWYLPWWFVILVLVLLAVVAYFVWRAVRFVRGKLGHTQYKKQTRQRRK